MIEGTCVGWTGEFGHVLGDDGVERFVHFSDIEADGFRALVEGMRVRFEPGDDDEPDAFGDRAALVGYSTSTGR